MKTYRVYTDDNCFDTVVSDYNQDEFFAMISHNGWKIKELSK